MLNNFVANEILMNNEILYNIIPRQYTFSL